MVDDPLEQPYWNSFQVRAWVYTQDLPLVAQLSDGAPKGEHTEWVTMPDGREESFQAQHSNQSSIFITMHAIEKGIVMLYDTFDEVDEKVLVALQSGKVEALGIKGRIGVHHRIAATEWLSLTFGTDENGALGGFPQSTIWHDLRFDRKQVMETWPSLVDDTRGGEMTDSGKLSPDVPMAGVGSPKWRSENAQKAGQARANQPGGFAEKKRRARDAYAQSDYVTKTAFAEDNAGKFGVQPGTIRKWLSGMTHPQKEASV